MKKRLTHVSPLQLGIVFAAVSGLISLVFVLPIAGIASLVGFASAMHQNGMGMPPAFAGIFFLILPVFYAVFGFIGGVVGGFIYNLVAQLTGGIEFTTEDAPEK